MTASAKTSRVGPKGPARGTAGFAAIVSGPNQFALTIARAANTQTLNFGAHRVRRSCDNSHVLRQVNRHAKTHNTGAVGPQYASSANRPISAKIKIGPSNNRQPSI